MGISFVRDRADFRYYFFQTTYFDEAFWYRDCCFDMRTSFLTGP